MPRTGSIPCLTLLAGMLAGALDATPSPAPADLVCQWQGRWLDSAGKAVGCLGPGDSLTVYMPSNTATIAREGIALCKEVWNPTPKAVNAVFLMDNSGSMEKGENSGGFNTPPGDPYGVRDRVIRSALRQLHFMGGQVAAGFVSFFGLGGNQDYTVEPEIETGKLQSLLDIGRTHPVGEANLHTLLRKVWKYNPNEALLPKVSATAKESKRALTYWSESLIQARNFLPPGETVKSGLFAFILISDGAIGDWKDVEKLIPDLPPVHGIHLGTDINSTHLSALCTRTGGTFRMVSPSDTSAFFQAMRSIVFNLTGSAPPGVVTVKNSPAGLGNPETLEATPSRVDSSGNLVLDLGRDLMVGSEMREARFSYGSGPAQEFVLRTRATAPPLTAGNAHFRCWEPSASTERPLREKPFPDPGDLGNARDALGKLRPAPGKGRRPTVIFRPPAR